MNPHEKGGDIQRLIHEINYPLLFSSANLAFSVR
jgi:hypothetical protein